MIDGASAIGNSYPGLLFMRYGVKYRAARPARHRGEKNIEKHRKACRAAHLARVRSGWGEYPEVAFISKILNQE